MKTTYKLGGAALPVVMLPAMAYAQGFGLEDVEVAEEKPFYTSEVEIGFGNVDENSYKFGQYSGLEDDGVFIIGNFYTQGRPAYDSDETGYIVTRGRNLGLESRELSVEMGRQGKFDIGFYIDQVPHNRIDNAWTVYSGVGSPDLTRPAGWPASGDATTLPLAANAMDLDVDHERNRFGLGLGFIANKHWSVDFDVEREERDGIKLTSGVFGSSGGNFKATIIPEPISYTTDTLDAAVNYTNEAMQFQVAYSGSFFSNDNSALRFDNLFLVPGGGRGWATTPDRGQMALAPDNQAHYLTFAGGYNFSPSTRVNGQVRYSWLLQDEDFLPYTINPAITVNRGLPRSSLDGEIQELLVDLALNSRLTRELSVGASLRYKDSDNDTPRNFYTYVHNDTQPAVQGALTSSDTRKNFAYEYEQLNLALDGTYRFGMMTKLKGGYEYEEIDRNLQEVDSTDEHTVFAQLSSGFGPASGWLKISHAEREADNYTANAPHVLSHHPVCVQPGGACTFGGGPAQFTGQPWENHPEIRKYYFADRDRDEATLVLNVMATDRFSIGGRATWSEDDYDDTTLGLTNQETTRFSIEPAFHMNHMMTAYAYYTWEELTYDQAGHDFRGFGASQNFDNPFQRWNIETEDRIDTFGLGFTWKKIFTNVDLNVEYLYQDASTDMNVSNRFDAAQSNGVFAGPGEDLPDLDTELNRFSLNLDYQYKENVTFRFLYLYEDFEADDFSLDDPSTAANETFPIDSHVVGVGNTAPDYDNHVFGASVVYRFE